MPPPSADSVLLASPCGARARISLHGGQLLSWIPAGDQERLYRSPLSQSAPGQAQRGGVPVIFPQFADQGPGPRHGLARTRAWQLVQNERGRDDAIATLRLDSNAETQSAWPHDFALELTVRIQGAELELELAVENTGARPMQFQAALHNYWRVADSAQTSVDGLQDRPFRDAASGTEGVQYSRRLELLADRAIDRLVGGPPSPLVLSDLQSGRSLLIEPEGFDDAVVWNPGPQHALADLPADDWRHFVCVELGQILQPVDLLAGESWFARQRVRAA